jgi:hypothetical protein
MSKGDTAAIDTAVAELVKICRAYRHVFPATAHWAAAHNSAAHLLCCMLFSYDECICTPWKWMTMLKCRACAACSCRITHSSVRPSVLPQLLSEMRTKLCMDDNPVYQRAVKELEVRSHKK